MAKKLRKYPKKPKTSASLAVWQRYDERCKAVDSYNREIIAGEKKKQALVKKHQNTTRSPKMRLVA